VQAYGGSYSSVTYSGNIRNEIGVMRFPCDEIAMLDGFEKQVKIWHRLFQKLFMRTTYPWRYVYFWWSRVCTALETVGCAPVFV